MSSGKPLYAALGVGAVAAEGLTRLPRVAAGAPGALVGAPCALAGLPSALAGLPATLVGQLRFTATEASDRLATSYTEWVIRGEWLLARYDYGQLSGYEYR